MLVTEKIAPRLWFDDQAEECSVRQPADLSCGVPRDALPRRLEAFPD